MTSLLNRAWVQFLSNFTPPKAPPIQNENPAYLMILPFYNGVTYFGGYETHPLTEGKEAPLVVEFPQLVSIEDIAEEVKKIVHRWTGIIPESVHLSSKSHPLAPLRQGRITVATAILPVEPLSPNLVPRPLSNLTMTAGNSWLSSLALSELNSEVTQ